MFTSFSKLWDPIPEDLRETRRQAFRMRCPEQSFQWLPEILLTDRRFWFICLWRFPHKLSLRELAEIFLQRGVVFTHEAVRDRDINFTPYLTDAMRKKRRGARTSITSGLPTCWK
jgi:hypothetical protein